MSGPRIVIGAGGTAGHVVPALAVAGAMLGFNFLGDALRDQFDPRTRMEMGL